MNTIVIGGNGGLGMTVCEVFKKRGDIVTPLSRSTQPLPCDITQEESTLTALNLVYLQKGRINNLVFTQRSRGAEDLVSELETNVTGVSALIKCSTRFFAKTGVRSIVIVTSTDDSQARPEQSEGYHISKAGLLGLVRYQAVQLASLGIRVNAVAPGSFLSNNKRDFDRRLKALFSGITPLKRMATAEDVANAVLFLCSDQAAFITGQRICVDGGISLLSQESIGRRLAKL